jgi:serine/threonine protein kinase
MTDDVVLRAMLGAGPDGTVYDAVRGEERLILHVLTQASRERIKLIRARTDAFSLLDAPHLEVARRDLNGARPTLALAARGVRLIDKFGDDEPIEADEAKRILSQLVIALEDAHQLALPHGRISPETVFVDDDGVYLDLSGAETFGPARFDEAEDVLGLGRLARWLLNGAPASHVLGELGEAALSPTPEARPSIAELRATFDAPPPATTPKRVGRFALDELLGKGAMGEVWSATDLVEGGRVAVKLSTQALNDHHRRRFTKEGRLLREIESPWVARLVDFNVYDNPFIALELVEGRSLEARVQDNGPLSETDAIPLLADVARGLAAAHARGIVHRDLKPANIMCPADGEVRAKLVDFGIARQIEQEDSLAVTAEGALLGTPYYMSPEQAAGDPVDTRSDLYSLGCVLYFAVLGRPPFRAASSMAVASKHITEPPPALSADRPELSQAFCELFHSLLQKDPERRPPSAADVVEHLEAMRGREARAIAAHPAPGENESKRREYRFEWRLQASPAALWPFVSDTERVNRAIGLGAPELELERAGAGVAVFGNLQLAGQKLRWQEHPYEWIEGRRMGILREFSAGPFHWLRSVVELHPDGHGTHLVHTIDLVPRGVVGVAAAALEVGRRAKKNLDRVYTRVDRLVTYGRGVLDDVYEDAERLSADTEERLEEREARAVALGAPREALVKLGDYLRAAPAQELASLRPRPLARRLDVDEEELLDACIVASAADLLELRWDLLCPSCRRPSQLKESLRSLEEHGSCAVCNLDFELDWARSIELVFRVHPELREADAQFYCVGGPAHSPHVAAQVRVEPGERFCFGLRLAPGRYRLASRWMPFAVIVDVVEGAPERRFEVSLGGGSDRARRLSADQQEIVIFNDGESEQLVRVERVAGADDAVTVDDALARPLFRRLFPDEVPGDGLAIRTDRVTLFAVDLRAGDDAARFYEAYRAIADHVRGGGGDVLKVEGDGLLARFHDPMTAARVARTLPDEIGMLAIGVHAGPAHVLTIEQRLDYFGEVPRRAWHLARRASDGEVAVSAEVAANPEIVSVLTEIEGRDLRVVVDEQRVPVL